MRTGEGDREAVLVIDAALARPTGLSSRPKAGTPEGGGGVAAARGAGALEPIGRAGSTAGAGSVCVVDVGGDIASEPCQ